MEVMQLRWDHLRWFVNQMMDQFLAHDCISRAASLTYTTLFAVVPMMTVAYAMFSVFPEFSTLGEKIQVFVFDNFLPDISSVVQEKLGEFSERAKNLTAVGFAFLFVTAFMMLVSIEGAFNTIWHVPEPRRGLQRFLLYWGVLSLGPPLMAAGAFISLYLVGLPLVSDLDTFGLGQLVLGYLPVLFSVATFTVLYYAVPNCHVPLKHALTGGFVAMLALEVAKGILPFIVRNTSMNAVYGTFAAIPLFLTWLWLVWVIVLTGATLVRTLSLRREPEENEPEPLVIKCSRILQLLYDAHLEGRSITDVEINRTVVLNQQEHERIFGVLQGWNLMHLTEDERWILGRNLKSISLWELYKKLPEGLSIDRLSRVEGMDNVVEPLRALAQFGSNEMSVSLDTVLGGSSP